MVNKNNCGKLRLKILNNCLTYKGFLNIICAGVLSYIMQILCMKITNKKEGGLLL